MKKVKIPELLEPRLLKITKKTAGLADTKCLPVYLVGGIVRDLIVKKKNLDLDFVVVGDAVSLARETASKIQARVVTHSRFNTATLICAEGQKIDVAMARAEEYSSCGVLPTVRASTIYDDLFRRDFTINAMAVNVNKNSFGRLIDPYNGVKDLKEGKIRILHEKSFEDDPTRILRAVRFEQRFNFSFERKTRVALKRALKRGVLKCITPQRFFHEFYNFFKEDQPLKYIKRMHQLKAWEPFFKGFNPDFRFLSSVQKGITGLRGKQGYEDIDEQLVYLMGLAATMSPGCFGKLVTSFGLTKDQIGSLKVLKKINKLVRKLNQKKVNPSQVYRILKSLPLSAIAFMRACSSSRLLLRRLDFFMTESRFMKLAVNGQVLQKMGMASDKSMGEILKELLCLKIDGQLCGSEEEMRMAESLISELRPETNRRA